MTLEKGIQPIDNVESDVVKVSLKFPANIGVSKKIGLDVEHLEKLCKLAGIGSLKITSHSEKDGGRAVIIGTQEDGSAVGGFEKTTTPKKSKILPGAPNSLGLWRIGIWENVEISVDFTAIQEKIAQSPKGLLDVEAWINILDGEIKREIMLIGSKALLQLEKDIELIKIVIFSIVLGEIAAFTFPHPNLRTFIEGLAASILMVNILKSTHNKIEARRGNIEVDNRLSIMNLFGLELDRAAVFLIRAQIQPLIKKIVPQ